MAGGWPWLTLARTLLREIGAMERRGIVGMVLAWLSLSACVPSLESRSAGQVGCTPDEISVSNQQTQFGLVQSGETWVAECHGRTFVCSQMNPTNQHDDAVAALLASEQVS